MIIERGALVKTRNTRGARTCRLPMGFGIITEGCDTSNPREKIVYVMWFEDDYGKPRPIHITYLEVLCK